VIRCAKATFVLASVTLMLEHVHSRAFVYRDLKPENVMFSADGFLKLVDFGFCKRLNAGEHTFTPCGTPEYVAPEITTMQGYGHEIDWWGVGVLVYDSLHGFTPFSRMGTIESDMAIMTNIRDPNYIVEWHPAVDRKLKDCCMSLMKHNRLARFGSADVRNHVACSLIDFQALVEKRIHPPFNPTISDPFDVRNFTPELDEGVTGASLFALEANTTRTPGGWDDEF